MSAWALSFSQTKNGEFGQLSKQFAYFPQACLLPSRAPRITILRGSMPSLRDSTLLPFMTRHFRAGLLLCRPSGTGFGFTAELCDGRAIVFIAGNVRHPADGKILIWINLVFLSSEISSG